MKRTLRVEEFSLQKAAGGGSILDAHFASGWVNFRCSFPASVVEYGHQAAERRAERYNAVDLRPDTVRDQRLRTSSGAMSQACLDHPFMAQSRMGYR